jgi:hypothetical protein
MSYLPPRPPDPPPPLCERCTERGAMERAFQPQRGRWFCTHCCPTKDSLVDLIEQPT